MYTGSLEQILSRVDYSDIIPQAESEDEAIEIIREVVGVRDRYIAFEVCLDP